MKTLATSEHSTQEIRSNAFVSVINRDLLIGTRWALTTSWFLMLLAMMFVGASLMASVATDHWHWFQRSGALLVSIGAVLSTQRALRVILDCMLTSDDSALPAATPGNRDAEMKEMRTCVCGFMLVAMGTLIWSYGDLLGCLLNWDGSCL